MQIKPRYDEYRSGAMIFTAVKPTAEDLKNYVLTARVGGTSNRIWRLDIDCRALVGKLMNHDELSKILVQDSNDFLIAFNIDHPKFSEKIFIGGDETRTLIVYRNRKLETYFKRVEEWLKRLLMGVVPIENLFNYGKRHRFGLLPNEIGQLCYVMVTISGYNNEKSEYKFGQPFTENTWGLVD